MQNVSELPPIEQEIVYALLVRADENRVARLNAGELANLLREDAGAVEFALFSLIHKRHVRRVSSGCWKVSEQLQKPKLRATSFGAHWAEITPGALARILDETKR